MNIIFSLILVFCSGNKVSVALLTCICHEIEIYSTPYDELQWSPTDVVHKTKVKYIILVLLISIQNAVVEK